MIKAPSVFCQAKNTQGKTIIDIINAPCIHKKIESQDKFHFFSTTLSNEIRQKIVEKAKRGDIGPFISIPMLKTTQKNLENHEILFFSNLSSYQKKLRNKK